MKKQMESLGDWVKAMKINKGFSYHIQQGDMLGEAYYTVSTNKDREEVFKVFPTNKQFMDFIDNNKDLIIEHSDYVIGGWDDEGTYYFDIATIYPKDKYSREDVLQIINDNSQIAGFDLESGEVVASESEE